MDSVRCLFDAYEPKQKHRLTFPVYSTGASSSLSIDILSATDSDPAALQSGVYLWPASHALSEYLCSESGAALSVPEARILELGAGAGLAGIVAVKRFRPLHARVVLTDRDHVSVDLLEQNLVLNGILKEEGAAAAVSWGDSAAAKEQLRGVLQEYGPFDMVIGSDLIYSSEVCAELFWTVKEVLIYGSGGRNYSCNGSTEGERKGACFVLCSSFRHEETTRIVEAACERLKMRRECVQDGIGSGGSMIEIFRLEQKW